MTIQPTLNNILIQFVAPLEKTDSGLLHLPGNAQKEPREAIIIAVGPGRQNDKGETIPTGLAVGQRVLVRRFYDMDVSANGKQYRLAVADDVVAVLS